MAYEMKDMSFSIFKVNKTKDGQPDYRMELMFKGEKLRVAMWRKQTNSGEPFWSGNIEIGDGKQQSNTPFKNKEAPPKDDLDEPIPF